MRHEVRHARGAEPHRPAQGGGPAHRPHRRQVQDHRHRAYAYERHDVAPNQAYGYVLGATIAKGRVRGIDTAAARRAPGVVAIVTTLNTPRLERGRMNAAYLFGGDAIQHYHQAVAVVVAETFEQARAAAFLVRVDYARARAVRPRGRGADRAAGGRQQRRGQRGRRRRARRRFRGGVRAGAGPARRDLRHRRREPRDDGAARHHRGVERRQAHAVDLQPDDCLEQGQRRQDLGLKPENVRVDSPYVGGGFGGKLFVRADAVLAALGARAAGRPVKVALTGR